MPVLAGFQLATPPAQPQSQGAVVPFSTLNVALVFTRPVITVLFDFRPPDRGNGYAY